MEKTDLRNPYKMKRKRSADEHRKVFDPSNDVATLGYNNDNINDDRNGIMHDTSDKAFRTNTIVNIDDRIRSTTSPTRTKFNMSDLVVSASDKAGMDGIDRAAIDAIIERESGNSLFMQQQKKRDEKVNQRIAVMKQKMETQLQQNQIHDTYQTWRTHLERQIDIEMVDCVSCRPFRSCKVVVDMDMFYMACELLSRPDVTPTTPACVGGNSMITTSNYAARRYGVRAAMPGYIGAALVQQLSKGKDSLIFCPLNFDLYKEKSVQVRQVLSEYDPHLTAYSLDEAYMDLAPYLCCSLTHTSWTHQEIKSYINPTSQWTAPNDENNNDDIRQVEDQMSKPTNLSLEDYYDQLLQYSTAECFSRTASILNDMREHVRLVTGGLTCSAGCAPNFLLAKIASDIHKPNGQCMIPSDHQAIVQFLHPLPIRKISGIGRVTEKILRAFDIVTVQQLYQERAIIRFLFDRNPSTSNFLIRASFGCGSNDSISSEDGKDSTGVASNGQPQKGISRERTIPSGKSWAEINSKLEDIAGLLSEDMQKKDLAANTIYVKVKLHTFDLLSHGRTLPRGTYIHSAKDLIQIATELLHEVRQKEIESKKGCIELSLQDDENNHHNNIARQLFSVRLLGIRCTNFKSPPSRNDIMTGGGTQKTMDQFLVALPNRPHSVHNITPTLTVPSIEDVPQRNLSNTTLTHSANSTTTESCMVSPNPYVVPSPPERKQNHLVVDTKVTFGRGSVTDRMTIDHDTTSDIITASISSNSPTTDANDDARQLPCYYCPICQVRLRQVHSNDGLNRHIDTCLNGSTVQQMVREVNAQQQQQRWTATTKQQQRHDRNKSRRHMMYQHFVPKNK